MKNYKLVLAVFIFISSFIIKADFIKAQTAPDANCVFSNTLRVGSRGVDVACLQTRLGITADSSFGPKTRAAVIDFQGKNNLVTDGICGKACRAALLGSSPVETNSITLLSPNGGEKLVVGKSTVITWKTNGFAPTDNVDITLSDSTVKCAAGAVGCWTNFPISNLIVKNTGSYTWDTNTYYGDGGPYNPFFLSKNLFDGAVYKIKISVSSAGKSVSDESNAAFSIVSGATASLKVVTDGALFGARVGDRYTTSINAMGGTDSYNWSVSAGVLPPGLSLNPSVCVAFPCQAPVAIYGTPTKEGSYTFTLRVVSGAIFAEKQFTMIIDPASVPN